MTRSTTNAPALEASSANSCRDSSGSKDAAARRLSSSPTRIARSRAVFCTAGISDLRGVQVRRGAGLRRALGLLVRRSRAIGMAALDRHHCRDGMFENQLLLVVGLEHQRVLIETLD